jgi:sporulation protein YlmC with PRC-barrel domain
MIAAELRGGSKPSLSEALGWIGSRVDDIYGAAVGRLEDVWIDPGTGAPRWLLVQKGGIGGRSTLIPFEDANAGAGHVWIPYDRDVVADAPEVDPAAPLTQQAEAGLRRHYVMYATRGSAATQAQPPAPQAPPSVSAPAPGAGASGAATAPSQPAAAQPPPPHAPGTREAEAPPLGAPPAPPRPPAPDPGDPRGRPAVAPAPAAFRAPERPQPPAPDSPEAGWTAQPSRPAAVSPQAPPPPAPDPGVHNGGQFPGPGPAGYEPAQGRPAPPPQDAAPAIPSVDGLDRPYRVEIQLRGEVRISGELSGLRLTPIDDDQPG